MDGRLSVSVFLAVCPSVYETALPAWKAGQSCLNEPDSGCGSLVWRRCSDFEGWLF